MPRRISTFGAFIRGDVLLDPGVADFGRLPRGNKPAIVLNLTYLGGEPGWKISGAETISKHVAAEINGPFQAAGGGLQFQVTARLTGTRPSGMLKDEINLKTNDPRARPSRPP